MRQELVQAGGAGNGVVMHPGPRDGSAGNGNQDGRGIGHHQLLVAAPDRLQGVRHHQMPTGRQAARRQEATDDEERLHSDARVLRKPVEQVGRQHVGRIGHGAVEGKMVQHDQL